MAIVPCAAPTDVPLALADLEPTSMSQPLDRARNPIVYMPIESSARELDSRLLLGRALVRSGYVVVIGAQRLVLGNSGNVEPGLVLFKGANTIQRQRMAIARDAGHLVVVIDEEVFALADETPMIRDIDPKANDYCDLVLAQNDRHADVLSKLRGFDPSRIVVTGNPRADLLRPPYDRIHDEEAGRWRDHHGPFVLVNSNACAVNSIWGDVDAYYRTCIQIGWLDPTLESEREVFRAHLLHDQACFEAIRALLDHLPTALPGHRILLRPHPSERIEPWIEHYGNVDAISVTREGNHVALMKAADIVIHTSCTTGVEAALAGRPTISLVPEGAAVSHWYLSNKVNPTVSTPEDAIAAARSLLIHGIDPFAATARNRSAKLGEAFGIGGGPFTKCMRELSSRLPPPAPLDWTRGPLHVDVETTDIDVVKLGIDRDDIVSRLKTLDRSDGGCSEIEIREVWKNLIELRPAAALIAA